MAAFPTFMCLIKQLEELFLCYRYVYVISLHSTGCAAVQLCDITLLRYQSVDDNVWQEHTVSIFRAKEAMLGSGSVCMRLRGWGKQRK
jgi:hypothetical protein